MTRLTLISPPSRWGVIRRTIGIWLIAFLAVAPTASAANYYVDASTGNDANTALQAQNPATPWKTLTRALAGITRTTTTDGSSRTIVIPNTELASGDVINVAAGTYSSGTGELFPLPIVNGVSVVGPTANPPTAIVAGDGSAGPLFEAFGTDLSSSTRIAYLDLSNDGIGNQDILYFEPTEYPIAASPIAHTQTPQIDHNNIHSVSNSCCARAIDAFSTDAQNTFDALIDNNTFNGFYGHILLEDSGYTMPAGSMSPTISNNTFTSPGWTAIELSASEVRVLNGEATKYSPTITGNTFTGGQYGIYLSVSQSTISGNAQFEMNPLISGNSFSGMSSGAVYMSLSGTTVSGTASVAFAPQVINNPTMTGIGGNAISITASATISGSGQVSLSPTVSGNTISAAGYGVAIDLSIYGYGGNGTINPVVSGNTITGTSAITEYLNASLYSVATGSVTPVISNNTVSSTSYSAISQSVYVSLVGSAAATFSPTITNNTVTSAATDGMYLSWSLSGYTGAAFGAAARVASTKIGPNAALGPSLTSNATVTGNQISSVGSFYSGMGLAFEISGIPNMTANWDFSNNTISGAGADGMKFEGYSLYQVQSGAFNLTISGNTVQNSGDNGIAVMLSNSNAGGAGVSQSVLISNNMVSGSGNDGLTLSVHGGNSMASNDIVVSQNQLTGNDKGLWLKATGWHPLGVPTNPVLVSCNTISGNASFGVVLQSGVSTISTDPPADFGGGNKGSVGANQFFNNNGGLYDFKNLTPVSAGTVSAQKNWWGTTSSATIDSHIYDNEESVISSAVDFANFKVGPPTSCGNSAPAIISRTDTTNEDTPLTVAAPGVLTGASDPDNDPFTASLASPPANGTAVVNADGSYTYTPNANFNGSDTFTFTASDGTSTSSPATVTVTVVAVNDAPVATNDTYSTNEDTALSVGVPGVLGNDTDVDGNPLTAAVVSGPANGTLTFGSNGSFIYNPNANYNGPDSFTYQASDGTATSNTATVSITVVAQNDAPVAANDAYTMNEDTTLTVPAPGVLSNDSDPDADPLTSVLLSGPSNGSLTLNSDGSFTYTPALHYSGSDSFTYKAYDGTAATAATVSITITHVNHAPVAVNDSASTTSGAITFNVVANDSDVDTGDTLTITSFTQPANGTVTCTTPNCTYTANSGFSGTDSFMYTISDGNGGTASANVSVTVIGAVADLSVSVTAAPEPVAVGTALTYTLTVMNNGPNDATGASVFDALPVGVQYVSHGGPLPCNVSGSNVTCNIASLASGSSVTVTINALAPATAGTITDFAQVFSSATTDPNSANDSATAVSNVYVPGPLCPSTPASPLSPANGQLDVANPVTFQWTAVDGAVGYTVYGSIDGQPVQSFGNSSTTSLAVTLSGSNITWFVRTLFDGCDPIDSATVAFQLEAPDTCESHVAPTLVAPVNNSTSASSITFQWSAVRHTDGYRVWVSIDNAPFAALNEKTQATSFNAVIPFGHVEWYVEALFAGCPSTESAHSVVIVPPGENCGANTAASLLTPANGTTVHNQTIDFAWSAVPSAIGYEVYLALNNGTPTLIGTTTTATTLQHDVAAGNLEWFVRTLFGGCPGVDSAHGNFIFDPPPACPTVRPITIAPRDGSTGLSSPVDFRWSAVPGVTQYVLAYSVNHGDPVHLTAGTNHLDNVSITAGAVEWSVEADTNNCPALSSTTATFTVVPPPPPCLTPGVPELRAPANASSNVDYTIRWNPVPNATFYEIEKSLAQSFGGANPVRVDANEASFRDENTTGAPVYEWYRVRAVNTCNDGTSAFSDPIAVGILPPQQTNQVNNVGATPVENPQNTTYELKICIANSPGCAFVGPVGASFTAATDQPWLTVSPTSGTLPASGVTLTVTAATQGLGVGTNTGSVTVNFATAAQGRLGANGTTTSSSNVSVNLVAPVANQPKNTPPPDALIIPAVAHADGLASHFESDIRVSNTSPQPMKYQLTFTPSGEAGIKDGKQTTIDIDPGRTVALDDVLESWFGAGASATGAAGSLEIRPLTSSASSISSSALSGLPNIVTFASSRTYSTQSQGSLGTYVPAIPFANFIGKNSTVTLQQIAQSTDYRTNLGLVEGSGQPATVLIKMYSSSGAKIGEMSQQLNGGQHLQLNSVLARNNLNNITDGRIEVSVTSATGKVTAYASVLDNKTNDAQLVSPMSLSGNGSAKYVLPGIADQSTADGKTQTDLRLFNAGTAPVTATLALHVDGSSSVVTKDVTLGAGQVQTLDNVMSTLFGTANVGTAALHITTAAPANLIATAKTYTSLSTGTVGQFINAVTPAQAITATSRPLQLLQVEESNRFSTDVGVAEISGKPVDLEISVIPQDAKVAAKTTVSLQGGEFHTMHQLLKSVGLDAGYNARVTVKVIGGTGAATAYASTTDLATHDTTFVPAQ